MKLNEMSFSQIINRYRNILFITGPQLSDATSVQNIRDDDNSKSILMSEFLKAHPKEFYDFYRKHFDYRYMNPQSIHKKMAFLEKQGKILGVITQSVDNLHVRAGSQNVVELYGNIYNPHCAQHNINHAPQFNISSIFDEQQVPMCTCGAPVHPGIVLHDESIKKLDKAFQMIDKSKIIFACGHIDDTFPVGMLMRCISSGQALIVISDQPTPFDKFAYRKINSKPDDVFAVL